MTTASTDVPILCDLGLEKHLLVLEGKADLLNESTARANKLLEEASQRIAGMNIGLEFWYSKAISQIDPSGDDWYEMGFAKIEGAGWVLSARLVRTVSGFYQGDADCPYTNTSYDAPFPMLKASRELRIAAVTHLKEFLGEFAHFVSQTTVKVEHAAGRLRK